MVVSMLFGNPMTFIYSIAGAALSLAVMVVLKKMNFLSCVGVSVAGGVFHNVGQILVAMALLGTSAVVYYLVALAISGIISGILIGLCGALMIKKLPLYKI
jgi:heptaprenyl diphosphate synthase